MIQIENPRLYALYLKADYSVIMPYFPRRGNTYSLPRLENQKNLKNNKSNGTISKKAQKRLLNATSWLVKSATKKWVYVAEVNKRFQFRVNFITLTLPSNSQEISDHQFKKKLLHHFINKASYNYGLKNYIWRVETQANGNIHAHFLTDTFIHYKSLRKLWNSILDYNGLLEKYTERFGKMNFKQYQNYCLINGVKDYKVIKKRWEYGVKTEWKNPNTTDVHAVYKIKNIGAYIAKYMSKNDEDRRRIKGRLWASSYNITRASRVKSSFPYDFDYKQMEEAIENYPHSSEITIQDKDTKDQVPIGTLLIHDTKEKAKKLPDFILKLTKKIRWYIRNGIEIPETYLTMKETIPICN